MKRIGLSIITIAFLVGAYWSVLDSTTVEWPFYGVLLVLGFVGVALVRVADRSHAGSEETLKTNTAQLRQEIGAVVHQVTKLDEEKDSIDVYDLPKRIDGRILEHLNDFVEVRDTMKVAYGLEGFASVMGPYAGGERYLNRVWSASADGYIDEAHTYIGRALEQFVIAQATLEELEAQSQRSA